MSTTTVRIFCKLKIKQKRNKFLWANAVVVDENDEMCTIIEGKNHKLAGNEEWCNWIRNSPVESKIYPNENSTFNSLPSGLVKK